MKKTVIIISSVVIAVVLAVLICFTAGEDDKEKKTESDISATDNIVTESIGNVQDSYSTQIYLNTAESHLKNSPVYENTTTVKADAPDYEDIQQNKTTEKNERSEQVSDNSPVTDVNVTDTSEPGTTDISVITDRFELPEL